MFCEVYTYDQIWQNKTKKTTSTSTAAAILYLEL